LQNICNALISVYVCGEKSGFILESPYLFGDLLIGVAGLDINAEKKFVTEKLGELQEKGATEREVKVAMKDLGIARFVKIYKRKSHGA
jgi:alcohol-forming fatty acyl-CoA reductase